MNTLQTLQPAPSRSSAADNKFLTFPWQLFASLDSVGRPPTRGYNGLQGAFSSPDSDTASAFKIL